jgi:hypothetical protein
MFSIKNEVNIKTSLSWFAVIAMVILLGSVLAICAAGLLEYYAMTGGN